MTKWGPVIIHHLREGGGDWRILVLLWSIVPDNPYKTVISLQPPLHHTPHTHNTHLHTHTHARTHKK